MTEIFGPTIQGEGPDAGRPATFVRFGGCDLRCSWCDSPHAIDPALVRQAERLTPKDIARRIHARGVRRVVLTGGNPALHQLGPLIDVLRDLGGYRVAVETQGTVWRDWLARVDLLVVSPKAPSAGVHQKPLQHLRFMREAEGRPGATKIVVFGPDDLEWAVRYRARFPYWPLYLSVGTPIGLDDAQTRREVSARYEWLIGQAAGRREFADAVLLPQLHVVAFGTRLGV